MDWSNARSCANLTVLLISPQPIHHTHAGIHIHIQHKDSKTLSLWLPLLEPLAVQICLRGKPNWHPKLTVHALPTWSYENSQPIFKDSARVIEYLSFVITVFVHLCSASRVTENRHVLYPVRSAQHPPFSHSLTAHAG